MRSNTGALTRAVSVQQRHAIGLRRLLHGSRSPQTEYSPPRTRILMPHALVARDASARLTRARGLSLPTPGRKVRGGRASMALKPSTTHGGHPRSRGAPVASVCRLVDLLFEFGDPPARALAASERLSASVRFRAVTGRPSRQLPRLGCAIDRDRGEPRGSAPPTPPYVRVRIRRFEKLS